MRRLRRDERGLSESVQLAVVWPVLLLVTLGVIQAGIWLHARDVARRATSAAVDAASGTGGSAEEGRRIGTDLAVAGGLQDVVVEVQRGGTAVSATLRAEAPLILDLGLAQIVESAAAPRERLTRP